MNVKKGDILSLMLSKDGGIVSFHESKIPTFVYNGKQKKLDTYQHNRTLNVAPMMRPYYSKPLTYSIKVAPKAVGQVEFALVRNSTVVANKSVFVQVRVVKFLFPG